MATRRTETDDAMWTRKSAAAAVLAVSADTHMPVMSPTVAFRSIDGIPITSNWRPVTSRSCGTSSR